MISRFNYKPMVKRDSSKDDEFSTFTLVKQLKVLSTNKDGSVDKYVEKSVWKEEKSKWSDFIKSYDLGSVSEQVINHLTKGTPLVTAHTLPAGDYTTIGKGAQIKHEMAEKGITLEMILQAVKDSIKQKETPAPAPALASAPASVVSEGK